MKRLATVIATIALIGTSAFAATPKKKVPPPPPPPAPVYSWTGWYVGGNVGYSWGNANTDVAGNSTTFEKINLLAQLQRNETNLVVLCLKCVI